MKFIEDNLETIELCLEYYREKVKPFLENGNIAQVKRGMTNLIIAGLYPNFQNIFPYRSAPNCFHTSDEILAKMRGEKCLDKNLFEEFEAYLAQTKLSILTAYNQAIKSFEG